METVLRALRDALAFLLPVRCGGCGEGEEALCAACAPALAPAVRTRRVGSLTVHSGICFEGTAAWVIRAFKDGRTDLALPLGRALRAAAASVSQPVVFVPVPASRASMRRRGVRVVEALMRAAGLPVSPLLRQARRAADQRGLGRSERAGNVAGSLVAVPVTPGIRVVVVDDVVTTGATLAEAARALEEAGAQVVAAVTLAWTPRRGTPQSDRDSRAAAGYGGRYQGDKVRP